MIVLRRIDVSYCQCVLRCLWVLDIFFIVKINIEEEKIEHVSIISVCRGDFGLWVSPSLLLPN